MTALGFLVGVFALSMFGMNWIPSTDRSSGWFMPWFTIAGIGLLGLGFVTGSIVALRAPRRAGLLFLILMPLGSFCLAYPGAGFLVWHSDGGGYFESPLPSTAMWLTVLFYAPFLALPLAVRHRKCVLHTSLQ